MLDNAMLLYTAKKHAAVRTGEYIFNQLIPYIGNKRKLLWMIAEAVRQTGVNGGTFVDFFAGSSVVSRFAKSAGFRVLANDWEPYAYVIARCYVQCNTAPAFAKLGGSEQVFSSLNNVTPLAGFVTANLCPKDDDNANPDTERMFYTRSHGMKIDAMREQIQHWREQAMLDKDEYYYLLAAMMYSVSYTSNTSGVFKAFHRGWGGETKTALYRIRSNIELRMPVLHDNGQDNRAYQCDAQALAEQLRQRGEVADIAYLDPPYNQHPYGSNYHVLNTVALWDKPQIAPYDGGKNKSAIRTDWRISRRSAYNHDTAAQAYAKLVATIAAKFILTSYSTDGNISLRQMLEAAATRGQISCVIQPYKRYRVSSQRMSAKPMNAEFVLIIDTSGTAGPSDVERIYQQITNVEKQALLAHPETTFGKVDASVALMLNWGHND